VRLRLFSFASAVSLLLCVAAAALWVSGHVKHQQFIAGCGGWTDDFHYRERSAGVGTQSGNLYFAWGGYGFDFTGPVDGFSGTREEAAAQWHKSHPGGMSWYRRETPSGPQFITTRDWHGFGWASDNLSLSKGYSQTSHELVLPAWFVLIAAAVLPAIRVRGNMRRRKQLNLRLCRSCSYDLRATPDRCPECGTVPTR
jgi:hypothetical protein